MYRIRLNQSLADHKMDLLRLTALPWLGGRAVVVALGLMLAWASVGCASDTSYDRYSLSRLWVSQNGDALFFDATATLAYPANSSDAEAVRLAWIGDWLKLRNFCAGGYRVAERRAIRDDEYNPQRHSLRYRIECL